MNRSFLLPTLAALATLIGIPAVSVFSQPPAPGPRRTVTFQEPQSDGTLVERTVDAKVIGQMHRGSLGTTVLYDDGRSVTFTPTPQDAESQKLLEQERGLALEVRTLASGEIGPDSEVKKRLREKLVQIFDIQQDRRNREIAKIEERLGKLKDTLKKRDAAKDSIVDRRLETLTGGVDELGWEDSFGNPANVYGQPNVPMAVPRYEDPRAVPAPVAPRAGSFPVPELSPGRVPMPPAPARAPFAPGAAPGPVAVPPAPGTSPVPPVAPVPTAAPDPAASR